MTKNRADLLTLADFVKSERFAFDMGDSHVDLKCGSAGCIGGHAAFLWPDVREFERTRDPEYFSWDEAKLQEKLGLSWEQYSELCFPVNLHRYDRADAVKFLRALADAPNDEILRWEIVVG